MISIPFLSLISCCFQELLKFLDQVNVVFFLILDYGSFRTSPSLLHFNITLLLIILYIVKYYLSTQNKIVLFSFSTHILVLTDCLQTFIYSEIFAIAYLKFWGKWELISFELELFKTLEHN